MPTFTELVDAIGGGLPAVVIALLVISNAWLFRLRERDRNEVIERERMHYEARLKEALENQSAIVDGLKTIDQAMAFLGGAK